jgi:hypothetical protein
MPTAWCGGLVAWSGTHPSKQGHPGCGNPRTSVNGWHTSRRRPTQPAPGVGWSVSGKRRTPPVEVDDPEVVSPQRGVGGDGADGVADQPCRSPEALVVAGLASQLREQVPQMPGGTAQPAGLSGPRG